MLQRLHICTKHAVGLELETSGFQVQVPNDLAARPEKNGKTLLSALSEPRTDIDRLKKIREDHNKSRHNFSKSETKDTRKNLYEIKKNKK